MPPAQTNGRVDGATLPRNDAVPDVDRIEQAIDIRPREPDELRDDALHRIEVVVQEPRGLGQIVVVNQVADDARNGCAIAEESGGDANRAPPELGDRLEDARIDRDFAHVGTFVGRNESTVGDHGASPQRSPFCAGFFWEGDLGCSPESLVGLQSPTEWRPAREHTRARCSLSSTPLARFATSSRKSITEEGPRTSRHAAYGSR